MTKSPELENNTSETKQGNPPETKGGNSSNFNSLPDDTTGVVSQFLDQESLANLSLANTEIGKMASRTKTAENKSYKITRSRLEAIDKNPLSEEFRNNFKGTLQILRRHFF